METTSSVWGTVSDELVRPFSLGEFLIEGPFGGAYDSSDHLMQTFNCAAASADDYLGLFVSLMTDKVAE
jgi:hypothetical protein